MADYIYPVNDQSDAWGGPPVKRYFSTASADEGWYLAKCFRMIEPGDRIWAYATAPLQQVVGVGFVVDGPYCRELPNDSRDFAIDIEWDLRRNKRLVNIGPAKLFDRRSVPQTVRPAKAQEVEVFMNAYNAAGK